MDSSFTYIAGMHFKNWAKIPFNVVSFHPYKLFRRPILLGLIPLGRLYIIYEDNLVLACKDFRQCILSTIMFVVVHFIYGQFILVILVLVSDIFLKIGTI
jgi:hypothetical protein